MTAGIILESARTGEKRRISADKMVTASKELQVPFLPRQWAHRALLGSLLSQRHMQGTIRLTEFTIIRKSKREHLRILHVGATFVTDV